MSPTTDPSAGTGNIPTVDPALIKKSMPTNTPSNPPSGNDGNGFFDYVCSENGGSPMICEGGEQWFDGASAIAQVIKGSLNMWSGSFKVVYGFAVLPFRFLNQATGGMLFGIEGAGTAKGVIGQIGVIGGMAWIATSPVRFLNLLIGGAVGTINALNDTVLIGGPDSLIPRLTPLNLMIMGALFYCYRSSANASDNTPKGPSLNERVAEAQVLRMLQKEDAALARRNNFMFFNNSKKKRV
jgi:hypothetical protein